MKYFRISFWIVNVSLLIAVLTLAVASYFTGIFVEIDTARSVQKVAADHYTYELCYLKIRVRSGGVQFAIFPHIPAIPRTSPPDMFKSSIKFSREMTYPFDTTLPANQVGTLPDGTVSKTDLTTGKIPWHQYVDYSYINTLRGVKVRGAIVYRSVTLHFLTIYVPWLLLTLHFVRKHVRRMKRKRRGLCLTCGYDFVGNSDHCPECGPRTC